MKILRIELVALLLVAVGTVLLDISFLSAPEGSVQIAVEQAVSAGALLEGGDGVTAGEPAAAQNAAPPSASEQREKINLNTATAAELEALPGIGESRAAAIVAYREEHGAFQSIEELLEVPGIGAATLEKVRDMAEVR